MKKDYKISEKTMWYFGISATLKVMSEKIWANADQFALEFGFNRQQAKNENNFEIKALWTNSIFLVNNEFCFHSLSVITASEAALVYNYTMISPSLDNNWSGMHWNKSFFFLLTIWNKVSTTSVESRHKMM